MKYILILLVLIVSQEKKLNNCSFVEDGLKVALNSLISRNLINDRKDTLLVQIMSQENALLNSDLLIINDKIINIRYEEINLLGADIVIKKQISHDEDEISIGFESNNNGGTSHKGKLKLNCKEGKLMFKQITYVSSIE